MIIQILITDYALRSSVSNILIRTIKEYSNMPITYIKEDEVDSKIINVSTVANSIVLIESTKGLLLHKRVHLVTNISTFANATYVDDSLLNDKVKLRMLLKELLININVIK